MLDWIINNPISWQIGLVILPLIIPNKVVYHSGRVTLGKAIRLFTVTQEGKLPRGKAVLGYVLNCVAELLEGVVDGIRNKNKHQK